MDEQASKQTIFVAHNHNHNPTLLLRLLRDVVATVTDFGANQRKLVYPDPVAAIFSASVREGYVSRIWKSAEVIPEPKVFYPPTSIQNDLRPISLLLPTLAKVLEKIVGSWRLHFLEPDFDNNQFGCRRSRSTAHAIVAFLHSWMTCLDSGGSVRTVFVDFCKEFDLVNHNLLFDKLHNMYGIPNCLYLSGLARTYQTVNREYEPTKSRHPGSNLMALCPKDHGLALSHFLHSSAI